ncbi:MAG: hypothetical protein FWD59_06250 [Micrococcales bacterium]|nr:hypothetical protein [Micrococcales bacterium]
MREPYTPSAYELAVLAQAIAVAEKFEARQADYTSASFAPFAKSLADARAVYANPAKAELTPMEAVAARAGVTTVTVRAASGQTAKVRVRVVK